MLKWILPVLTICALPALVLAADHPGAGASEKTGAVSAPDAFAEYVAPEDSLPHLRYFADGKTTVNDRCPVRKSRLNPKIGASYVNSQPVGFC